MATITQTKTPEGKYTSIEIGMMSKEQGEKIKEKLEGKTYMNFRILVCPSGGSFEVFAETNYDGKKDDILGAFIFLMATSF